MTFTFSGWCPPNSSPSLCLFANKSEVDFLTYNQSTVATWERIPGITIFFLPYYERASCLELGHKGVDAYYSHWFTSQILHPRTRFIDFRWECRILVPIPDSKRGHSLKSGHHAWPPWPFASNLIAGYTRRELRRWIYIYIYNYTYIMYICIILSYTYIQMIHRFIILVSLTIAKPRNRCRSS